MLRGGRGSSQVKKEEWNRLRTQGFLVQDKLFGEQNIAKFREEIESLHAQKILQPNHTHFVKKNGQVEVLKKRNILEAEIAFEKNTNQHLIPHLTELFNQHNFIQECADEFPHLASAYHTIKVQLNLGGGGRFPYHFDSNGKDGRILTSVLYLNTPTSPKEGGQIQLFPFPFAPIEVQPQEDRLVMFSSTEMLHCVLPSYFSRYCLTFWVYGDPQNALPSPPISEESTNIIEINATDSESDRKWKGEAEKAIRLLTTRPLRRHFAKWYYRDEWENSVLTCHHFSNSSIHNYDIIAGESTMNNNVILNSGDLTETEPDPTVNLRSVIDQHRSDIQLIEKALSSLLMKSNITLSLSEVASFLPIQKPFGIQWF